MTDRAIAAICMEMVGARRLGFAAPWCVLTAAACYGGGDHPDPLPPAVVKHDAGDSGLGFAVPDGGEGIDASFSTNSSSQPVFPPTFVASRTPPPISGGTLLVSHDGARAIVSDPDRDAIYVVDLAKGVVSSTVTLGVGEEPGRIAEDGAGRAHVALRHGGSLVTIDEQTGTVIANRHVCPAPRGVSWDSSTDLVWVACATGELVAFPAAGGAASASFVVERDLRDVVASNGAVSVSQFRSATVLRLGQDGAVARRDQLPSPSGTFTPQVVWRAVPAASGAIVTVHQIEASTFVASHQSGGYGSSTCNGEGPPIPDHMPVPPDTTTNDLCGPDTVDAGCLAQTDSVVKSVLTVIGPNGGVLLNRVIPASVPVDVAASRDGTAFAAIAAGNAFTPVIGTVLTFESRCGNLREVPRSLGTLSSTPIAVAFDAQNDVLVQTREPAALWRFDTSGQLTSIPLSSVTRADTGTNIFHTQAGAMVACASCHPEGGDDGHVWMLDGNARRTPSLRGTIAGTAPYHWQGNEASLDVLVNDVYTMRMSGRVLGFDQMNALTGYAQSIPAPPAPSWVDGSAVARGKLVFESSGAACASCHSGAKLTNNTTVDVGTGGAFQVPPLVGVGWRTPLLHDGCASTIADRFGKCSTPGHGSLSLSPGDVADLSAYLESL